MKYLVATDIHGSAYWMQKVLDVFASHNADALILLGDVYNHGPRNPFPQDYNPQKVAEMLNAMAGKVVAVKGNCDSEVDQMISTFPFVQNNFVFVGGRRVLFTHGHIVNKDSLQYLQSGDVVLYGHFHKNEIVQNKGVVCVNVGSPSLPKDGVESYAVVDENGVCLYSFDGAVLHSYAF